MSVAVLWRHREHRSTIAVTSWRNRRVIHPRCSYASITLCAILLRSVRSRYDQHASAATVLFSKPWRSCYRLGVLANSRPGSSALLKLLSLFWILGPLPLSGSILM